MSSAGWRPAQVDLVEQSLTNLLCVWPGHGVSGLGGGGAVETTAGGAFSIERFAGQGAGEGRGVVGRLRACGSGVDRVAKASSRILTRAGRRRVYRRRSCCVAVSEECAVRECGNPVRIGRC